MKHHFITSSFIGILLLVFCSTNSTAKSIIKTVAHPFSKLTISDQIDLVLQQGEQQVIEIDYFQIDEKDIVIEDSGKRLSIYLKGCKRGCSYNEYSKARVLVKLTYKNLEKLIIMGDNNVQHLGNMKAQKFTLKSYGDNKISFKAINADKFKTSLYGDNHLRIESGNVTQLKLNTLGDHTADLGKLICKQGKVNSFGDSVLDLNVAQKLNLTSLGDSEVQCTGNPWIDKKLVLGDLSLKVYN